MGGGSVVCLAGRGTGYGQSVSKTLVIPWELLTGSLCPVHPNCRGPTPAFPTNFKRLIHPHPDRYPHARSVSPASPPPYLVGSCLPSKQQAGCGSWPDGLGVFFASFSCRRPPQPHPRHVLPFQLLFRLLFFVCWVMCPGWISSGAIVMNLQQSTKNLKSPITKKTI